MKFYYDLHIHSDLSPCGNEDMTPNNIVNMSYIKGLNIISVTDHNTTENLPALMEACSKMGIMAVPGIEVTSKEEVHVLCYFRELCDALKFGSLIYDSLPNIKNMPDIFGQQNIYNSLDVITGTLDKLLINASGYSLKELSIMAEIHHGNMVPAHINKKSNSILGILGFIPYDLNISIMELFGGGVGKLPYDTKTLQHIKILKNSDAHSLTDISEADNCLELNIIEDIYDYLQIKC